MEPEGEHLPRLLTSRHIILLLGVGGLICLGYGLYELFRPSPPPIILEKSSAAQTQVKQTIIVDIEGAVIHPGVYELDQTARMQDVLIKAGGMSSEADREVVAKTINLAAKVSDGAKIYIPFIGETVMSESVAGAQTALVSINSATVSQLDSLPGVGEVTAHKIIKNRPYSSLEELKSKKAVNKSTYEKIKALISL